MNPTPNPSSQTETILPSCRNHFDHPTNNARREAFDALAKLYALGVTENPQDVLWELHSVICTFVELLNTDHPDLADSVTRWPILLPQEKEERIVVTEQAKRMSIGSVKAVAMGQPVKLNRSSERGFALSLLEKLDEAKGILRAGGYSEHKEYPWEARFGNPWNAVIPYMDKTRCPIGIDKAHRSLLLAIRDLPEYCQETRDLWIEVMLRTLKVFPNLVPSFIQNRKRTTKRSKTGTKQYSRGSVEKSALKSGLKNVTAIPRVF